MSNKLIELTQEGVNVALVLIWGFVALLVILGISGVVSIIHSRKEKRLRETKYDADSVYSKRNNEILEMDDLDFAQKQTEREKAREERDAVYKDADSKIKALDKKFGVADDIFSAIRTGIIVMCCMLFMYLIIFAHSTGGTFSDIREVKDTQKDNVAVTAYYRIDYERVEQDTLTIFVKNNSDKVLDQAQISEKETGASAYVYTLEPGQEKIVTITVFPNSEDKYEFDISNIEFKQ